MRTMGRYTGAVMTVIGLAAALYSGWYVTRGPFFGGQMPETALIPVAAAGFIVGAYLFAAGVGKLATGRKRDRPDLEGRHRHTSQEFFDR